MEHKWIQNVCQTLINDLKSDDCARESLLQLQNFRQYNIDPETNEPIDTTVKKPEIDVLTGEQILDADGNPKYTIARMKEATLSIFGALFLDDH